MIDLDFIGETGLTVEIYDTNGIANGVGGDTLTEDGSIAGKFTATITETLSGWKQYWIRKAGYLYAKGDLYCIGATWIADDPTVATVDNQSLILAKLDALKGPGDESFSILITDDDSNPVIHCSCWVSTDILGNNVITDIWETDSSGTVDFLLDPGTYYLFRQKNGVNFTTNPRSFTVA